MWQFFCFVGNYALSQKLYHPILQNMHYALHPMLSSDRVIHDTRKFSSCRFHFKWVRWMDHSNSNMNVKPSLHHPSILFVCHSPVRRSVPYSHSDVPRQLKQTAMP